MRFLFLILMVILSPVLYAEGDASLDNPASLKNAGEKKPERKTTDEANESRRAGADDETQTMTRDEYNEAVRRAGEDLEDPGLTHEDTQNIGEWLAHAKRTYERGDKARGRGFNRGRVFRRSKAVDVETGETFGDDVNAFGSASAGGGVEGREITVDPHGGAGQVDKGEHHHP